MKFLKYVIGIIIAISVIPIIIISIDKVSDPVNKTINFNIIYDIDNEIYYLDPNVYDDLVLLIETNENNKVTNLVSYKIDDIDLISIDENFEMQYDEIDGVIVLKSIDDYLEDIYDRIMPNNTYIISSSEENLLINYASDSNNASVSITFRVPSEIPSIVLVLLGLIPVVFISGILYVIFKKQNE